MAERLSTGFLDLINVTGSVKTVMANGVIGVYGGTQPASADDAEGTDLLLLYTLNSGAFTGGVSTNGLNMGLSTDGVLAKAIAEVWSGVGLAAAGTGTTGTWFRWYDNSYTTGADTTTARVDGAIGTSSSFEMQMGNTRIAENGTSVISAFNFYFPAS